MVHFQPGRHPTIRDVLNGDFHYLMVAIDDLEESIQWRLLGNMR